MVGPLADEMEWAPWAVAVAVAAASNGQSTASKKPKRRALSVRVESKTHISEHVRIAHEMACVTVVTHAPVGGAGRPREDLHDVREEGRQLPRAQVPKPRQERS